jgi:hypothetical protein
MIRPEDRQAQRLLWEDGEYAMNVMTFGAVCSPSSSQFVKNLNARRFERTKPLASQVIVDHHYVDDFIYSMNSECELIELVKDVIDIHASGGFHIRNFISNSTKLLNSISQDKLSSSAVKAISDDKGDATVERVLGLKWTPDDDNFIFQLNLINIPDEINNGVKRPTKREVLKLIMSVFDPLGFLLHITIKARILLQDI